MHTLLQDLVIFRGLLQDLFPGTDPSRQRDPEFEVVSGVAHVDCSVLMRRSCAQDDAPQAIATAAVELGLEPHPQFVEWVVQLAELLAIRHCVFLMGPTGMVNTERSTHNGQHTTVNAMVTQGLDVQRWSKCWPGPSHWAASTRSMPMCKPTTRKRHVGLQPLFSPPAVLLATSPGGHADARPKGGDHA